MKTTLKNPTKSMNLICALLMALLVLLQFMPFWTVDGETVSVMHYMGFPDEHNNLSSWLDGTVSGGFMINDLVAWFFFTVVLAIVGVVLCIKYREKALVALIPSACGIVGVLYCINEQAFRLGQTWVLQLLMYILLLALAVCNLVFMVKGLSNQEE